MLNTIYGQKTRMSQTFTGGRRTPVTQIKVNPCVVTQIKSEGKDGYCSIQIGFGTKKFTSLTKPEIGHLKGAKLKTAPLFLREISLSTQEAQKLDLKVGDQIKVDDILHAGDTIKVTSTSKGKGFAGV